jgi:hypothetical protein
MVIPDQTVLDRAKPEPADIVDRLLWRDAQRMLSRHAEPGSDGTCVWCGWQWPCAPRRLAERAELASQHAWRVAWTVRHDMNSIQTMADLNGSECRDGRRRNERPVEAAGLNRGPFD